MLQRIFHGIGQVHARFRKILRKKPGLKNFRSLQHVALATICLGIHNSTALRGSVASITPGSNQTSSVSMNFELFV